MRLAPALILCALVAPGADSAAGPRAGKAGKIVRVERPRTGARGVPRICQLRDTHSGMCWGAAPVEGELAYMVDESKNRGQIKVSKIEASADGCQTPQYWNFELDPLDADFTGVEPYRTWVVLDVEISPSGRVLDPGKVKGPDDQSPWLALARRGGADDAADFVVTAFACDEDGKKLTTGYGSGGYCLEYFTQAGARWDLIRRDVVMNCRY